MSDTMSVTRNITKCRMILNIDHFFQALTLNALPSVSLTFPPVGLQRMFLQPSHVMVDWA